MIWAFPDEVWCLWLALLLDITLRDPPNNLHPVAWMGAAIQAFQSRSPRQGRWKPLAAGILLLLLGGAASIAAGVFLPGILRGAFESWAWACEAIVLKCCFAIGGLFHAGQQVRSALEAGDLPAAQALLGRHLVSRDTSRLNESQVAAATVESLAENTNDSIIAPLLWYSVAGLPGVLVYRFVNTCDAMLGYRDARHEWLGKAPARIDDLLNLLPARMTAAFMIAASLFSGRHPLRAMQVWLRDRHATASPNAGHSMSVAAGALGIELEKVGCYRLGNGGRPPTPQDISRAVRLLWGTVVLAVVLVSMLLLIFHGSYGY